MSDSEARVANKTGASVMRSYRLPHDTDGRLRTLAATRGETQTQAVVRLIDLATQPRKLKKLPPHKRDLARLKVETGSAMPELIAVYLMEQVSQQVAEVEEEDVRAAYALVQQVQDVCAKWLKARDAATTPESD
jgi:hypothetical protein